MKRFILPLLGALVLFAACSEKPQAPDDQTPSSVSFSTSPGSLNFPAGGGTQVLTLTTDSKSWKTSVTGDWVTVSPSTGSGNREISVTAAANKGERRMVSLSFSDASGARGTTTVSIVQEAPAEQVRELVATPPAYDISGKRTSLTYQLLIYSFADSDGDGIGDFNGIVSKLDYLDGLGVTALWLSPAHPSDSYHAYDVDDYYAVNPLYGTEQDFRNLIDKAHQNGIKVYMDYVLNHSGKGNPWFTQALSDPASPYRNYYFFSSNPSADYSSFPMLKGTTYNSGEWKKATSGSPALTIRKTDEAVTNGTSDWNLWFWKSGSDGKAVRFTDKGDGTFYLVMDIDGSCGMLVRKYMNWNNGSKFGAVAGSTTLTEGKKMDLVAEGANISFSGSGRYRIELTNVSTETLYYMGAFSDWMPDLNYGDVSSIADNACFKDLAASADKWIGMGVDGFRLDAVKHICGGIASYNNTANQTLLKAWYERCNASYKAAGHPDDIFMVAEAWDGHGVEKQYYKGINSCFEFEYWGVLKNAVMNGQGKNYAPTVSGFIKDHTAVRPDAITSLFMTNHDQNRAAGELGKDPVLEKQAAAMLLTSGGRPFVYQGEELGYWGTKEGGDEYVRTPVLWDKAGKDCAKKGPGNKVDNAMLTPSISVEAQLADASSLLQVYRTFGRLRTMSPALAEGEMAPHTGITDNSVAAWYMTAGGQKFLVIHNVASSAKTVLVSDSMEKAVALLGSGRVSGNRLTLDAHSSVVLEL
jgi:glycosidase